MTNAEKKAIKTEICISYVNLDKTNNLARAKETIPLELVDETVADIDK